MTAGFTPLHKAGGGRVPLEGEGFDRGGGHRRTIGRLVIILLYFTFRDSGETAAEQ